MKRPVIALALAAAVAAALAIDWIGDKPKEGFVPDAKTAIKIAVAVWEPIYGEKQVADEKPYRARLLTNSVRKVEGSLQRGTNVDVVGGLMTAEIAKEDGRVLRVYHTA